LGMNPETFASMTGTEIGTPDYESKRLAYRNAFKEWVKTQDEATLAKVRGGDAKAMRDATLSFDAFAEEKLASPEDPVQKLQNEMNSLAESVVKITGNTKASERQEIFDFARSNRIEGNTVAERAKNLLNNYNKFAENVRVVLSDPKSAINRELLKRKLDKIENMKKELEESGAAK
jgi:hypothetical protein